MKKGELTQLLTTGLEQQEQEREIRRQAYIAEMREERELQLGYVWSEWMQANADRTFTVEGLVTRSYEAFYLNNEGKLVLAFIPRKDQDGNWINNGFEVRTTTAPVVYLERLTKEDFGRIASTHSFRTGDVKVLKWAQERFAAKTDGIQILNLL